MTAVQVMGLALATVLLANASALGIYFLSQDSAESIPPNEEADAPIEVPSETAAAEPVEAALLIKGSTYTKTPYSDHYAISVCEEMADSKYSGKLVHRHIVDLSTRYDDYAEFFVVVIYAHLGTRSDYSEVKVYCHVNPKTYAINYFKDYPA